jgi:alpha-methylacyl-CoA racemase
MGPLAGFRIIEIAGIGPIPFCGMLLADMGAEVIRIDRLQSNDLVVVPSEKDVVGRGRRSVAVDLKHPLGKAAVLRLAAKADGLIEGFRPGVAERLGIGPDDCHTHNPRLVYGRMTGFGQTGPLAQAAGHDLNYIALVGALASIRRPNGRPIPPLNLVADYGGGALFLALGMVCAFLERVRSNKGQIVDAAMTEGAAVLMSYFFSLRAGGFWNDKPGTNLLDGGAPFYDVYGTADAKFVAVAALEPRFFSELAERIGLEERFAAGQMDRSLWPAMRARLTAIFRGRSRNEWVALLEGTDACLTGVLELHEVADHPQSISRNVFQAVSGATHPSPAPRFSRSVPRKPAPSQPSAEEARAVLIDGGFSLAEIEKLREAGAIAL